MKTYDNSVYKIGKLLRERHVCLHSRKAHERCYSELRDYLITSNLNFSLENARDWLKEGVKAQISKNEFQARWHYVDQLDELIRTGTVLQDHLLLTKPNYEKLSEFWKVELDDYLKSRERDYSAKSFALANRITSYNVCYTKLLRDFSYVIRFNMNWCSPLH